jgi:predicted NBD/HSP70 family sugar kinase
MVTGKASVLRSVNRGVVLGLIRTMQPISRSQIAKLSGLNPSTVSDVASGLLREELIYEKTAEGSGLGRTPVDLYLKCDSHYVGAMEIRASVSRVAIANICGKVKSHSSLPTNHASPAQTLSRCAQELLALSDSVGVDRPRTIGVSISGVVDPNKARLITAPSLQWENVSVGELLREKIPLLENVVVGDAVKASALAEMLFGNRVTDTSNFVFLSIGKSVGAGIIIDGRIVIGDHCVSGELSHMAIYEEGLTCECGVQGCWEAYISDRAVSRRYMTAIGGEFGSGSDVGISEIVLRASKGDAVANLVIKQTGHYIGVGVAAIIRTVDPKCVVIDGSIADAWDLVYPEIMKALDERPLPVKGKFVDVFPASEANREYLKGAVALALQGVFNDYKIMNANPWKELR